MWREFRLRDVVIVTLDSGRGKCRLQKTRARVLEGHLQDQGGVGGFHDNS